METWKREMMLFAFASRSDVKYSLTENARIGRLENWNTWIGWCISGLPSAVQPKMWVLVLFRNQMQECLRAPRHVVDGPPQRRTVIVGVHVSSFGHRYLLMCAQMYRRVYPAILSERLVCFRGSSGGCTRADRRHSETYVTYVNKADG